MFKGISNESFGKYFREEEDCLRYLSELKWKEGYKCKRCGYDESPTTGTLFHRLKFGLLKAFGICFIIRVRGKGMSSCGLSRAFDVGQKTACYFKRKAQETMKSSEKFSIVGRIEMEEFVVGQKGQGNQGRAKGERKIVIVRLEKVKGNRKSGRAYVQCINGYGAEGFDPFFDGHIDVKTHVITDKWTGYSPLKDSYKKLEQVESGGGKNFLQLHAYIMKFKGWLRRVHHHCSENHIQGY